MVPIHAYFMRKSPTESRPVPVVPGQLRNLILGVPREFVRFQRRFLMMSSGPKL